AQGTHPAMSESEKLKKIGLGPWIDSGTMHVERLWYGRIYDHGWNRPEELVTLGELTGAEAGRLTGGLMDQPISLTASRLLGRGVYDTVLVFGATMPHEVAGVSGGAKDFFPGGAGPELAHAVTRVGGPSCIE